MIRCDVCGRAITDVALAMVSWRVFDGCAHHVRVLHKGDCDRINQAGSLEVELWAELAWLAQDDMLDSLLTRETFRFDPQDQKWLRKLADQVRPMWSGGSPHG